MPIPWDDDDPAWLRVIAANVGALLPTLRAQARTRAEPHASLACGWHRAIYRGVTLPASYYAGEFRDTDPRFPELIGYDVAVGGVVAVPSSQVPGEVAAFERAMRAVAGRLDPVIDPAARPRSTTQLAAVIRYAAFAHGEWVRIHPFANGNGRTARCWANFIAARYGLPAFVTIKPRPSSLLYAQAARASMTGDHAPTEGLFAAMLAAAP